MRLERAIAIAAEAHAGQTDKAGEPYILHPLRVMLAGRTEAERIVGVLHDVVEDTDWTLAALAAEGLSAPAISGIAAVTRREGESYDAFIVRAGVDPVGRAVKIADLRDNMDLGRIAAPTEKDRRRLEKYRAALARLEGRD